MRRLFGNPANEQVDQVTAITRSMPHRYMRSISETLNCCFVQPVQSPYWTERFRCLAGDGRLQITLLLEREGFSHRPGWKPEAIPSVDIRIIGSRVIPANRINRKLRFRVNGIRSIPLALPLLLRQIRPDVVVVCNATQALLAWLVRYLLGFRLVLMVEDTPHSVRRLGLLSSWLKAFSYRRMDRWFVFSDDSRQYLAQIGITKNVVRSSWSLDMDCFRPRHNIAHPAKHSHVEGDRRTIVLFVGRLIQQKGVEQLIDAWATLPARVRNTARLLVYGDGPLKSKIAAACASQGLDEVELVGHVEYAKVRGALGSADLFVFPTLEDLYGLALLEAMASGCPVVTTPFTGGRELVEEGKNGWIVDPTEPGALRRVLEKALAPDVNLELMGSAARARVAAMDNALVMRRFADEMWTLARECV